MKTKYILLAFFLFNFLWGSNFNQENYFLNYVNIKSNINVKEIDSNKKLKDSLSNLLNEWKINNKYNVNFILLKGFKNYFPVERISLFSNHYCLNSNNKHNYCLISSPFEKHKIKMIEYPNYNNAYPYNVFGYYIDNKFIIVFLNIDKKRYKYINQNIIDKDFAIKLQFLDIKNIFEFFQKINKNVLIFGNFYSDKNTIKQYIDNSIYKVLLNQKDLIFLKKDINKKNTVLLLENFHIIKPTSNNIKIFSRIDLSKINKFAKIYKLKNKDKKKVFVLYKEKIGESLPINIELQLSN